MIVSYETSVKGLTVTYDDYETRYEKNGNSFVVNGEQDCGEAWLNGKHYFYELRDEAVVLLDDEDEETVVYTIEHSEEGWEQFANSVL